MVLELQQEKKRYYGNNSNSEPSNADNLPRGQWTPIKDTGTRVMRTDWTKAGKPMALIELDSKGKPSKEIDKMAKANDIRSTDSFAIAGRKALMAFEDGGGDYKNADKILKDALGNTKYQFTIQKVKDTPTRCILDVLGKDNYLNVDFTRNELNTRSFKTYDDYDD